MTKEELRDRLVMVVDDDAVQLEVLANLVRTLGAECETTDDPSEAYERLRRGGASYAMLITDIFMPGQDGFSLAERVRGSSIPPTLPILGVTVDTDPGLFDRAITAGMNGMMLKPVTAEVLGAYFTLMFKAQRASSVFNARLQSRLDQERRLERFVNDTARGIRTPLTAIMGIVPMLTDPAVPEADRGALCESIMTACETMNRALNDSEIGFSAS